MKPAPTPLTRQVPSKVVKDHNSPFPFNLEISHCYITRDRSFAYGLRNPVGLDFYLTTNELYTTVNERDKLGDNLDTRPEFKLRAKSLSPLKWTKTRDAFVFRPLALLVPWVSPQGGW